MILALEPSHGSGRDETAGVTDCAVVLLDFVGDFPVLTNGICLKGASLCGVLEVALFLDTLEDSSGLDEGVSVAVIGSQFGSVTGDGDFVAAGVDETAVCGEMLGGDFCLLSAGRCGVAVREDSGGEFVHEVAFLFFALGDGVTGAFAFDVVEGDNLLLGADYGIPSVIDTALGA